ncbi:kinase-like protein [Dothidotthia symphoricarpi CBS 119687]|uniref:Kinase-like protein n=1 Tax=Dothidotthia symphoricarpi CBS 119687 TaxID=1392245 RepID=A0A6A6AKI0_9PLEO|nr:kinase-like protein [Dothidotthia symphoricarpi CBS 119687]KAF2132066.1 kinase-like protein [Dothidotthia symphoricarpi CBS 119687]
MDHTEEPGDRADSGVGDIICDWSQTGRGFHVDFGSEEAVPLEEGRFLGRGAAGYVHETTIRDKKLAWKRIPFRRKIGKAERKEIDILKKVSHVHMIQLVGTYTHNRFLGILMYPVAVCDLHTFFEDVEAHWTEGTTDAVQQARLEALAYVSNPESKALPIFTKVGCLVSAIAYLHANKIRHKDLKPSNILLSRDHLWLSDFGSATDFSLLSQSATDNERGTPRYWAPEMAEWKPSGRAADIFSLGCVLLEVFVLQEKGTLLHLRQRRSRRNPLFHANLDRIDEWVSIVETPDARQNHFVWEIRAMLSSEPKDRPLAADVLARLKICDDWAKPSIFGACCKTTYVTSQQHQEDMSELVEENENLRVKLYNAAIEHQEVLSTLIKTHEEETKQLKERYAHKGNKGRKARRVKERLANEQSSSADPVLRPLNELDEAGISSQSMTTNDPSEDHPGVLDNGQARTPTTHITEQLPRSATDTLIALSTRPPWYRVDDTEY